MVERSSTKVINSVSSSRMFSRFAWGLLGYTLLVILWGVYVRATGSGAGCGGHWPTCNGQIIPTSPQMDTIIEFAHRLTSGLTVILSIVLVVWGWRIFTKGHPVRLLSASVVVFTLTEAIIGAGLVLFGLTATNDSVARAITISLHLVNTLLLLGSLSLAAWYASDHPQEGESVTLHTSFPTFLVISLAGMLVLSITGTITALGDTLFPASSLTQGLMQDVSPLSSFLIRLRVIHPILAVTFVSYTGIIVLCIRSKVASLRLYNLASVLLGLLLSQLALGAANILLLAPVWLQLIHLLTADLVWIFLVLFSVQVIQPGILKTS